MSRKKLLSLTLSFTLAATTVFSNFGWSDTTANVRAAETETETVVEETQVDSSSYGLCDNIQDGVILHCFDWKLNDIKAELKNIAEAGFTSIQTSPVQKSTVGTCWYEVYQPESFSVQSNPFGSKEDLKALCDEADKYGIKIIVDVVANHTRSIGDDGLGGDCYHYDEGGISYGDDSNRYDYTHKRIGMPDLNSESSTVQNKVKGYVQELKSVGVDGIRWDAAKHIGLPSENCNFWPAVTGEGLYNYGEILNGPLNGYGNNDALMKEYTNYISVTDDEYGEGFLKAIDGGGVPSAIGNYSERGVSKDKLVYWAESHDTYANNGEYGKQTAYTDQNKIDRAYALLAGQAKATCLYFSRPSQTDKYSINSGVKGSTHFKDKEVAAVNHLHNSCVGQKEYYVNGGDAAAVCRETGAVIVKGNGSGQVSIKNGGGITEPGTYTDEVSGSTWTVTADTISGTVGDKGIAVIYDGSVSGGGNHTNTDLPTPSPGGNTSTSAEANTIVASMPSGWSDLYIYAYEPGETATKLTGEWPGTKMTAGSGGKYIYKMDASVTSAKIIFASGASGSQDPVDVQGEACGYDYVGGKAYSYEGGKWSEVTISTATEEPEKTPSPKPEKTATPEPTKTDKPEATEKPTATPGATEKPTAKPTGTPKPTTKPTGTPKPTIKPTGTPKATLKPTATPPIQSMDPGNVPNNTVPTQVPTKYYNINYELNNGYFVVAAPGSYTGEQDVTLPFPVREGYTFVGWYTDSAFTKEISVIKAGTKGDLTIYAKWKKVSKPSKPVIATVKKTNSKKKIKITLKKKVTGAVGYEVVIAKNAKFTKGKRVVRFSGLSKQISNLKAGKYYIKVRAYKLDSTGQRIYGAYCVKTKTIVLKK